MFYSQYILAKKGPLGKIWIAAHFEKKLTKHQIFATDIRSTVDALIHPKDPLSLRLCGQLMLGIVRIYSRKASYLMVDCTDAVWKIQLAIKPGKIDIEPQKEQIPIDDIKYYGKVEAEMDYPVLDNIAFAPRLLSVPEKRIASSQLIKPLTSGENFPVAGDEFSGIGSISDLEFNRNERERLSSVSGRVSLPSGKQSLAKTNRFEDISLPALPAFDENFTKDMPTPEFPPVTFEPAEYELPQPSVEPFKHEISGSPEEEEKVEAERPNKRPRRRMVISFQLSPLIVLTSFLDY
jgi:hypothetical protein